ncbi:hypothetical protein ACFQL8_27415 [Streptomyces goshikiensis]|uniref:hypothetical protein n=1 Tax=Streptomyces goshikiensis TaxID=1942 RepID=UPI001674EE9B|nr:hypothetical protein [Streptomyces goshikiensis]
MNPTSAVECVRVHDGEVPDGRPHHPATYEIRRPQELAEVLAVWPDEPVAAHSDAGFVCMCWDPAHAGPSRDAHDPRVRELPDAVRPQPLARLLDRDSPDGIPARHRARWAAAAPGVLRGYAEAMARGEEPRPPTGIALAAAFTWRGAVREHPLDAASLLAEVAPLRVLAAAPTAELARAVCETDGDGLDAAVRFFASEEFTARHPKHRRVPDGVRDVLLRYARSRRPGDLAVLERRLLRAPGGRVRRS